jgi:hypothetical protein
MNDGDFDDLIDRYFSGEASAGDLAALEGILRDQPGRRLLLAKRSLLEVHLRKAFSGLAPTTRPAPIERGVSRSRRWQRVAQGTAVAILCIAVGVLISASLRRTAVPERIAMAPAVPSEAKHEETKPAVEPKRESGVIKGAMASLDEVKNAARDLRKNDGLGDSRPIEPKKGVALAVKPPDRKPDASVEPGDDGKQGILVPAPKAKTPTGPRDIRGTLLALDAEQGILTLRPKGRGLPDRICAFGENMAVFVRGKAAGVDDLSLGMEVRLRLADDRLTVLEIREGKD